MAKQCRVSNLGCRAYLLDLLNGASGHSYVDWYAVAPLLGSGWAVYFVWAFINQISSKLGKCLLLLQGKLLCSFKKRGLDRKDLKGELTLFPLLSACFLLRGVGFDRLSAAGEAAYAQL